jgi:hypothetical protein
VPHPRGPGSKPAHFFLIVDDYSRLLIHARWVPDKNTRAGQDTLRRRHPAAWSARVVVRRLCRPPDYVDLNSDPRSSKTEDVGIIQPHRSFLPWERRRGWMRKPKTKVAGF